MDIVRNNTAKLVAAMDAGLAAIVADATKDVYAEGRAQLQQLIYDTPESPHYRRTHNLYNSARWEAKGNTGYVRVGGKFDVGYAVYVHEGTARMPARPYLAAAARVVRESVLRDAPVKMELTMGGVR